MEKNLAELCSSVLWRVKLASDEIVYLAEKQSIESVAWVILTACSILQEGGDGLKKELLS